MKLDGLAAIVTGGASGLGAATARAFADAGARVTIFDLNEGVGKKLAGDIGGLFFEVDVADGESTQSAIAEAEVMHGTARILVNCAGIAPPSKTVSRGEPHDLALFEKVIRVNLIGTFNCTRLAAARMAAADPVNEEERGVIICTASVAAYEGQVGQAAYSASKGGVAGMTLPIARDLADKGIRVVSIAPGIFLTPMVAAMPQDVQDSLGASVPFPGRLGRPEEYAALARHIVENAMLNGTVIRLDGAIRMEPR